MKRSIGERVKAYREQVGWTQEHLARLTDVGVRTIQRIESGESTPSLQSLQALAAVFDCDVSTLQCGLDPQELKALGEEFLCPTCGSRLTERIRVPHEYGDDELEVFECGFHRGSTWRPCSGDPQFPKLEEYDLVSKKDGNGTWHCHAMGRTSGARAVALNPGHGMSEEEAKSLVVQNYEAARRGR